MARKDLLKPAGIGPEILSFNINEIHRHEQQLWPLRLGFYDIQNKDQVCISLWQNLSWAPKTAAKRIDSHLITVNSSYQDVPGHHCHYHINYQCKGTKIYFVWGAFCRKLPRFQARLLNTSHLHQPMLWGIERGAAHLGAHPLSFQTNQSFPGQPKPRNHRRNRR